MTSKLLKGLYVLTDDYLTPWPEMPEMVEKALDGGVKIVQFRSKNQADWKIKAVKTLKKLCDKFDALLIIDDDAELALLTDAHGVHLGKDDIPIKSARDILGPDKIIGASCYNDLALAAKAADSGADYVAFGSFFDSNTKPLAAKAEIQTLTVAKNTLRLPICAIGGITAANAISLLEAGANMTAVISDIWKAGDIKKRAEEYAVLFEKYGA